MSVPFKTIERKNLQDPTGQPLYYAIVAPQGKTDIDGISAIVSDTSTVSRPDVYAVNIGTVDALIKELLAGRSVHLGKLGSFTLSLSSEGMTEPGLVTAATIHGAKIIYRPGPEIKDKLKGIKYEKKL